MLLLIQCSEVCNLALFFKMSFNVTKDTVLSDFCNHVEVKFTLVEMKEEIRGFGRQ